MALRVLVIDDEEDMRVLATVFLEMEGEFAVTAVGSGQRGVEVASSVGTDVILLDYMMPDMDGRETLESLKLNSASRDIPVIFLTGKSDFHTQNELKGAGALGVIQKPFRPETLSAQILSILNSSK